MAGEPHTMLTDNTNILYILIVRILTTENNNNIAASFLQVGIVGAFGATLPKPELCCSFTALLSCLSGFEELLSPMGPHSAIGFIYDLICHNIEYSFIMSQAL